MLIEILICGKIVMNLGIKIIDVDIYLIEFYDLWISCVLVKWCDKVL